MVPFHDTASPIDLATGGQITHPLHHQQASWLIPSVRHWLVLVRADHGSSQVPESDRFIQESSQRATEITSKVCSLSTPYMRTFSTTLHHPAEDSFSGSGALSPHSAWTESLVPSSADERAATEYTDDRPSRMASSSLPNCRRVWSPVRSLGEMR